MFLASGFYINGKGEIIMTKQFPIKIGNNANVAKYASTLTNGEEQLLITRQGEMFVTDGMG